MTFRFTAIVPGVVDEPGAGSLGKRSDPAAPPRLLHAMHSRRQSTPSSQRAFGLRLLGVGLMWPRRS